jgi:small-conductance mechanosensitive channel
MKIIKEFKEVCWQPDRCHIIDEYTLKSPIYLPGSFNNVFFIYFFNKLIYLFIYVCVYLFVYLCIYLFIYLLQDYLVQLKH